MITEVYPSGLGLCKVDLKSSSKGWRSNFFGSFEQKAILPPANLTGGIFNFEPSEIDVARKYLAGGVLMYSASRAFISLRRDCLVSVLVAAAGDDKAPLIILRFTGSGNGLEKDKEVSRTLTRSSKRNQPSYATRPSELIRLAFSSRWMIAVTSTLFLLSVNVSLNLAIGSHE